MIQTAHLGSLPRGCELVPFEAPSPRSEQKWIIWETADIADPGIA